MTLPLIKALQKVIGLVDNPEIEDPFATELDEFLLESESENDNDTNDHGDQEESNS